MPYGYLGQNQPNQTVSNSGVFSITDVAELQSQGKLGGSLELIAEQTLTNSLTVDFTDIKETKYDVHFMTIENVGYQAQSQAYLWQFYESGVLESATVYQWANQLGTVNGTFVDDKSTGDSGIRIDNTSSQAMRVNSYTYFYNLGNSNKYSFATQQRFSERSTATDTAFVFGGGVLPQASTVDGIRFLCTGTTNLTSGTFKLYGVKQI